MDQYAVAFSAGAGACEEEQGGAGAGTRDAIAESGVPLSDESEEPMAEAEVEQS